MFFLVHFYQVFESTLRSVKEIFEKYNRKMFLVKAKAFLIIFVSYALEK